MLRSIYLSIYKSCKFYFGLFLCYKLRALKLVISGKFGFVYSFLFRPYLLFFFLTLQTFELDNFFLLLVIVSPAEIMHEVPPESLRYLCMKRSLVIIQYLYTIQDYS